MFDFKNRTALITGASSGIGASFANALARRGCHVVLVARSRDKLTTIAAHIEARHGVGAHVIAEDLARPDAATRVLRETAARGIDVGLLVNNAGFATYGRFEAVARERQHEEIMLNVGALVDLAHAFLPAMVARGDGAIINVASTAAFQPVPYMAVYGASKAFVLSFSEALWAENRRRGVRVLALCPGATETPFFDVVQAPEASVGRREHPDAVVARALAALARGRSHVVSGWGNRLAAGAVRLVPRATAAAMAERVMRPRRAPAAPPPLEA
jgi:short-subunit dehydrogenase